MSKRDFPSGALRDLDPLFDLVREAPVQEALTRVVEIALEAVPSASHASVAFGNDPDHTPVFSDLVARALDEALYAAGSGPALDVRREGEVVRVLDMSSEDRWPRFAEEARRRGIKASLSLPLNTTAGTMGALNLYADAPKSFDSTDAEIASLIASRVAVGLSNADLFMKTAAAGEQLREALRSRDIIGQAKGILMATEGSTDETAFKMLVTASQHSNRKLRDVAQAIIDQHLARLQD